jgi:hypothetical protein
MIVPSVESLHPRLFPARGADALVLAIAPRRFALHSEVEEFLARLRQQSGGDSR